MRFKALQENLRKILWGRIRQGDLTGLRLAAQTGFRQAHISNFLNRKRSLSTEGMDKVLAVQRLSVLDLLDPAEINKRASILPLDGDEFENVAVVDHGVAAHGSVIMRMKVKEIVKIKRRFLQKLRPEMEGNRRGWERFVAVHIEEREGLCMYPRLSSGGTVVIDRHYNSLKPYRKNDSNIYAISKNGRFTVKYVELSGRQLVLRPHNQAFPVEIVPMDKGKRVGDYLIGRVCHVALEI